ncbi:MAG: DUF3566 domain-containing protein [Chloroflexota bacterium]
MHTTLKHIDIGSAFRVGVVVYALLFAVFGLLFVLLQGLLLSSLRVLIQDGSGSTRSGDLSGMFMGAGVLSLLCFYGVGIVFAAIAGGIQFAVGAFCYNRAAHWVGGVKVELESSDELPDDL